MAEGALHISLRARTLSEAEDAFAELLDNAEDDVPGHGAQASVGGRAMSGSELARWVRDNRRSRGLTQPQLAEAVGVSHKTIFRAERESPSAPIPWISLPGTSAAPCPRKKPALPAILC